MTSTATIDTFTFRGETVVPMTAAAAALGVSVKHVCRLASGDHPHLQAVRRPISGRAVGIRLDDLNRVLSEVEGGRHA